MRIFHRIDDIQKYSYEIKKILDFFEMNTKEFIVAAIPDDFSEEFGELFRGYKNCTVYQHGYGHSNHVSKGWCDEFPDTMDIQQKKVLLKEGKQHLEDVLGTEITGYVPPWNNTGDSTLEAIKELGIKIYSAQENNTKKYLINRDIGIDIVHRYVPEIEYKDLDEIYKYVVSLADSRDEIGIMYHFKNTSEDDFSKICEFIMKLEKLNK